MRARLGMYSDASSSSHVVGSCGQVAAQSNAYECADGGGGAALGGGVSGSWSNQFEEAPSSTAYE